MRRFSALRADLAASVAGAASAVQMMARFAMVVLALVIMVLIPLVIVLWQEVVS